MKQIRFLRGAIYKEAVRQPQMVKKEFQYFFKLHFSGGRLFRQHFPDLHEPWVMFLGCSGRPSLPTRPIPQSIPPFYHLSSPVCLPILHIEHHKTARNEAGTDRPCLWRAGVREAAGGSGAENRKGVEEGTFRCDYIFFLQCICFSLNFFISRTGKNSDLFKGSHPDHLTNKLPWNANRRVRCTRHMNSRIAK